MMIRNLFGFLLSVLAVMTGFCGQSVALGGEILFDAKADETIRVRLVGENSADRRTVVERQKVAFHHLTLWGNKVGAPDHQVIAKETINEVVDQGREGVESKLRVELFFAPENLGKFSSKPTQTIEIPDAHEAQFEDGYWSATTLGCCDAEPYSRMYAYGADHPFLRYNEKFWKIEVPNAHGLDRYVGMVIRAHVPNEAAADAIFGKDKRAVAAISLAAPGKPLDTVFLVAKEGVDSDKLSLHTEKLEARGTGPKDEQNAEGRTATLWSLDGAEKSTAGATSVKGVMVEAGVYVDDGSTETLRVEIEGDKFVHAQVMGDKLKAVMAPGAGKE